MLSDFWVDSDRFSSTYPEIVDPRLCSMCCSRTYLQCEKDGVFRCHRKSVMDYVVIEQVCKEEVHAQTHTHTHTE